MFQAEDGIRDLVRSRGLGDVYKRQVLAHSNEAEWQNFRHNKHNEAFIDRIFIVKVPYCCLLYTSDAADERSSVDLGGRRIIKKKTKQNNVSGRSYDTKYRYHALITSTRRMIEIKKN